MYAVVACSRCRHPWLIEARHATVACPHCRQRTDVAGRRVLWEGRDPREGRAAVAALRTGAPGVDALPAKQTRHDDVLDAAAAQARRVRNLSERAELAAAWLTRLKGPAAHEELVETLHRAGLDAQRADKEIVRMLACDVIFEPAPGIYKALA